MGLLKGKVRKFGDNISTDLLMPGFSIFGNVPDDEVKNYCMHTVRPDFVKNVRKGDMVVCGKNFGCGSSCPAAKNLLELGVCCVLADSISAPFFRNSKNLGLPVFSDDGVSEIFEEGDPAECHLSTGEIVNTKTGARLKAYPIPEELLEIIDAGGIVYFLKQEAKTGKLYHKKLG
jgi:3-isopropylmalate/(R)-2-methylmalate dehydratase small subunit